MTCAVAAKLRAVYRSKVFCRWPAVRASLQRGRIHLRLIQLRSESLNRKQVSRGGRRSLFRIPFMTPRSLQSSLVGKAKAVCRILPKLRQPRNYPNAKTFFSLSCGPESNIYPATAQYGIKTSQAALLEGCIAVQDGKQV